MEVANITEPAILIKSKWAFENFNDPELRYEYTRGYWNVSKERAEKTEYAFLVSSVKDGYVEILEIYKPFKWFLSDGSIPTIRPESTLSWLNPKHKYQKRYEFLGELAKEAVRAKYIGQNIKWPNAQNLFKYINI